ncbi:MAG: hypothetical protein GX771_04205 [Halomonadaceae bacterium]|nr:hypothetical protein [Halomonadaceae bacterium]
MSSQDNNRDIQELNLAYLFCIREMARRDLAETALRFGIDQSLVQALADSSVDKIRSIADPSMLQFKMRASTQMRTMLRTDASATSSLLNAVSLIAEAAGNE